MERCPHCGGGDVVRGWQAGGGGAFIPLGLRVLGGGPREAPVRGELLACAGCGLVWDWLDAPRLREVLRASGTRETRERLGGGPSGGRPPR